MADNKQVDDPGFKPGVMSPTSKQTFADLRANPTSPVSKPKLVVDEDTFEQSFLKCSVCHERYNTTDKMPRLLPCHHSFCDSCIAMLFQREIDIYRGGSSDSTIPYAVSIHCPNCNAPFITTADGLSQLTTDHRIIQLLDFVGFTDRHTINYCTKHTVMPLNFFCEPCVQPVCRDCTVLDHKSPDKHMVLDINSALQKYTPVLENGVKDLESEISSLQQQRKGVEDAVSTIKKNHDDLCKEIRESFDRLRTALNERETDLIQIAAETSDKNTASLKEKVEALGEKEQSVSESIQALRKARNDGSVQDVFTIYQRVRDYKSDPPISSREIEEALASKVSYSGRDEKLVVSRISGFGEILSSSSSERPTYSSSSSSSYPSSSSTAVGRPSSGYSSSYSSTNGYSSSRYPTTSSYYSSRYGSGSSTRSYRY